MLLQDQNIKEFLFKNEKLKQLLLKQINSEAIRIFEEIKNNPNEPITEEVKTFCKNYLQNYFREGMEIDILNNSGKRLFRMINRARQNSFISEQYMENKIWANYCQVVNKLITRDVATLTKEEIKQYDEMLEFHFDNVIMGYANTETEMALKIAQRPDIDLTSQTALDYFTKKYAIEKDKSNAQMIRRDANFSIILDYDMLLRERGIKKERQYSPIAEMDQLLKCEILLDNLTRAIAQEKDEEALKLYQEYQDIYQKITGKKFPTTFEELIKVRK